MEVQVEGWATRGRESAEAWRTLVKRRGRRATGIWKNARDISMMGRSQLGDLGVKKTN